MAEKDKKKLRITGLKASITDVELKGAIAPLPDVGGEEKIEKIDITSSERGAFAYILFKDEASATAAQKALGEGKDFSFPELSDNPIRAEFADGRTDSTPLPQPPQPRLTRTEVEDIARSLAASPRFAERCKGRPGEPGKDASTAEVVAKLTADPAFWEKITGKPGEPGKDSEPADVATALKADSAFMAETKGKPGEPGKDGKKGERGEPAPKKAWLTALLLAIAAIIVAIVAIYGNCGKATKTEVATVKQTADKALSATEAERQVTDGLKSGLSDLKDALKTGNVAVSQQLETIEGILKPKPEPTPPVPTVTTPPVQPVAPHAVGVLMVRSRFDQIEVRLDQDERTDSEFRDEINQRLNRHFCAGSGPHDPALCPATAAAQ